MTDKQQPAQFDWATELSDAQGRVTLSEQEAKEIGARLRSMGEKLKVYEDLGDAADDMQLLRMGYAAARLEIESLRKEHADELTVAYMCGASREKELAAQPSNEHQRAIMEGERNASLDSYSRVVYLTQAESRIYETAFTNGWNRRASLSLPAAGQEPVADRAFLERTLSAMEGVIDVADRKTAEFDALRSCVIDLTLMLFCKRCRGSGEDPEGYYDQSRGPDGGTHEGPCRDCGGSGAAPQPAVAAGWKSIESAPKDGQAILVSEGRFCYCVEWNEELDWWAVDDNKLGPFRLRGSAPTYWMPLPPAPSTEGESNG